MAHRLTRREFGKIAAGAAALAACGLGRRRPAPPHRQKDVALYRAIGSAGARPDLDDRLHHPQSRLHGVRHAVRDRRRVRAASADGRRLQHLARQADLSVSSCATGSAFTTAAPVRGADCVASIKRWMARDGHGQAIAAGARRDQAGRRQGLHDQAQGAVSAVARRPRQGVEPGAVRHAGAARQYRSVPAGHRDGRLGPVQIRQGRVRAGPPRRLRQEHRLRAAQGAAELGLGRQGGQGRPRRMALHPRCDDQGRRRSTTAKPIGGRTRRSMSVRCWPPIPTSRSPASIRSATRSWCGSTTCCRPSTIRRCARRCWR